MLPLIQLICIKDIHILIRFSQDFDRFSRDFDEIVWGFEVFIRRCSRV